MSSPETVFGMSLATYTLVHVLISLAGGKMDRMHNGRILDLEPRRRIHLLPLGVVDQTRIAVGAARQKGDSGDAEPVR